MDRNQFINKIKFELASFLTSESRKRKVKIDINNSAMEYIHQDIPNLNFSRYRSAIGFLRRRRLSKYFRHHSDTGIKYLHNVEFKLNTIQTCVIRKRVNEVVTRSLLSISLRLTKGEENPDNNDSFESLLAFRNALLNN